MNTFSKILIGAAVVIALLNAFSYREAGGYVMAGAMVVAAFALDYVAKRRPTKPPSSGPLP